MHVRLCVLQAVVMFVSESGICRGPLAAAAFTHLLEHSPLREWVQVEMRVSEWGKGGLKMRGESRGVVM